MTPTLVSAVALLVFSLGAGLSVTNATTIQAIDHVVAAGAFTQVQTNGMDRRQDRRDTRQDCRSEGGLMGADKRNCKQEGRSGDDEKTNPETDDGTKE